MKYLFRFVLPILQKLMVKSEILSKEKEASKSSFAFDG
jgi:hypothetical protein